VKWKISLSIALLATALFSQDEIAKTTVINIGDTLPSFSVTTIDGKILNSGDLIGKVMIVAFFTMWCGSCDEEMPRIETDIWQKYRNNGLAILAVGREHKAEELIKYAQERGFTFPIAPDPERKVYNLFASRQIPRAFLVDKTGKIIDQTCGFDEEEFGRLTAAVKEALEGK